MRSISSWTLGVGTEVEVRFKPCEKSGRTKCLSLLLSFSRVDLLCNNITVTAEGIVGAYLHKAELLVQLDRLLIIGKHIDDQLLHPVARASRNTK